MAKKVFLSVLGTGYYEETQYYFNTTENSCRTRFIQEATINEYCQNWSNEDKIVLFLTEKARKFNWCNPAQVDNHKPSYTGLSHILENNSKLVIVNIPDGNSEDEMWEVFNKVYNVLDDDDEVYFDITHAFRFLPMLLMVLINYAKLLKSISVKSVTYGNYEAREIQQDGSSYSPVMKVTQLSELQDWTIAALMFKETGQTRHLNKLISSDKKTAITNFTDEITEVRSMGIISGQNAEWAQLDIDNALVCNPIFKNIKNELNLELSKYKTNCIENVFSAVEFCITHNLTQQGLTILLESIITYILLEIGESDYIDETKRNAVAGALSINKLEKFKAPVKSNKSTEDVDVLKLIAKKVFELPYKKKLSDKVYKSLSQGARNDINHAGYRENPKEVGYFKGKLEGYYNKTIEILNIKP